MKNISFTPLPLTISKGSLNSFFIACKESRIESSTSYYGCFYLGPFDESLSQTLANDLRRTLLSELTGLAITSVEIEGAMHKFSNLPGIRETVLDIVCNLQNIVFKKDSGANITTFNTINAKKMHVAYLKVQGPGIVKSSDLKLPPSIQCVDPNQYIATLSEDGILNMKLYINEGKNYIKQTSNNLTLEELKKRNLLLKKIKNTTESSTLQNKNLNSQPILIDAVFMPVTKVNTIIEDNEHFNDSIDFKSTGLIPSLKNNFLSEAQKSFAQRSTNEKLLQLLNKSDLTVKQRQSIERSFLELRSKNGIERSSIPFIRSKQINDFLSLSKYKGGSYTEELNAINNLNNGSAKNKRADASIKKKDTVFAKNSIKMQFTELIKLKPFNKKCNIILEIWTNGSIHPREALSSSFQILSDTFLKLQKVKVLGTMYKSDITYRNILNKNFNLKNNNIKSAMPRTSINLGEKLTSAKSITNSIQKLCLKTTFNLRNKLVTEVTNILNINNNNSQQKKDKVSDQFMTEQSNFKISSLFISLRTYKALENANIKTIAELCSYSKEDLLAKLSVITKDKNILENYVFEIERSLAKSNMKLRSMEQS